ncbi:hypothetical protein [Paracoccus benzoatiresistens]|uniref:Uncharacterized protein n=1 Tax=Paracoccus benzoatiresistens TaxID=2997341 RepID=A0ABT4J7N9_9RHOB|nr:hypothetical protein [Paracoccus sp. EF6]MCZ0963119.1 hypothetical protein [Paracoccus sp. EF6]
MAHFGKTVLFGLAGLSPSACVEDTAVETVGATPTPAEPVCFAEVSRTANNGDVVLLGSGFSEAGTLVRVGVGEQRAPWKCIAYSDGTTGGIEFMGSEG